MGWLYLICLMLFFAPVLIFWLWIGLFTAFVGVWLKGWLALWTMPYLLPALFLVGFLFWCGFLFDGSGLLSWVGTPVIIFWVLPIALGIWLAKRYPLQRNPDERS